MMKSATILALLVLFTGTSHARMLKDNQDSVAREKCYDECFATDGWHPICSFNPNYPAPTSHGGGTSVWPNFCMAQCMAQYWKYPEWDRLEKIADLELPEICKTDMWKIYYLDDRHEYDYNQTIIDECNPKCALPMIAPTPLPAPAPAPASDFS